MGAEDPAGPLLVEHGSDGVLALTLNRPEKRNALSIELREALAAELGRLDPGEAGAVVITGAGSAFCAGMDVTQFGGDRNNRERLLESSLACMRSVGECPVPVLAAVNGPALAGGFVLALAADVRIAEPAATFGFPELPRGIPPSFAWARAALPAALATELCISGRVIDAESARADGVVSELAAVGRAATRAREVAAEISSRPRGAITETKRRILLQRERLYGFLFEDEERMFRTTLLGDGGGSQAAGPASDHG
ncbi:MAG TPA: enoyl-CoA hydratase/isomerase family protein [Solirubrobacterales bacterium]|nr:enoyl-CoA hydratase/isomerase family protein [Solirubrobacterales bacterium]